MSIAVYNSSDVDISRYIIDISGLEKIRDINNQITIPTPKITAHTLEYNIDDELYVLIDGVKKFHLYIYEIGFDSENQEYLWKCRDILYKLKDYKVYLLSSSWWTLGGWHSTPSNIETRYEGAYSSKWISLLYILKVMLHVVDNDLAYGDFISMVDSEVSPYRHHDEIAGVAYERLAFQWEMFQFMGRPSDSEDVFDCLTLFEVFNWILNSCKLHVEYTDDKYYIRLATNYTYPANTNIYKRDSGKGVEEYATTKSSVSYDENFNNYINSSVTLTDHDIDASQFGWSCKAVSLPTNFLFFRLNLALGSYWLNPFREPPSIPNFIKEFSIVQVNYYHYPISMVEIETDITADNAPYENKLNVEDLTSKIKCKNPDYGFPLTLPLILR